MDTMLGKYRIDKIDCDRVTKFEIFLTGIKNQYIIGNVQVDMFLDTPTVIFKYYQYVDNDIEPPTLLQTYFTRTDFIQNIYLLNPNEWFQPTYLNISNSNLRDTESINTKNYAYQNGKILVYNDEGAIEVTNSMSKSLYFEYAYVIDNTNDNIFWYCYDTGKQYNYILSHSLENANNFTTFNLPTGIPYIVHYDPTNYVLELVTVGTDNKTITYQKIKLSDNGIVEEQNFSTTLDIAVTQLTQVLDNDQGYGYRTYFTSYLQNDDGSYIFDVYKLIIDPINEEISYVKLTSDYFTYDSFKTINTKLLIYDNTIYIASFIINDSNTLKIVVGYLDNNSIILSSSDEIFSVSNVILFPSFLFNNILRYMILVKTTEGILLTYIFNKGYLNKFIYSNSLKKSNSSNTITFNFNLNKNIVEYMLFDSTNNIYHFQQEKIFSYEMIYEDYSYNQDLNEGSYYIMFINLYNEKIIKKNVKLLGDNNIIFLDTNSNYLEFETLPDTITLKKFKVNLDNIQTSRILKITSIY